MQEGQNEKKKVLFMITKSNFGGAQRYVYDLAVNLPKEQFDVAVAFGGTGKPGAQTGMLHRKLEQAGIRTVTITHLARDMFPLFDIRAFFEIISLLQRERPHVLHINSSKAGGLGAVAGRFAHTPHIVFTSHGLAFEESRAWFSKKFMYFFTWLTFVFSHTSILISQDSYRKAGRMWFLKNKLKLIHNGVPEIEFVETKSARNALQQKSSSTLAMGTTWIGTISELTKNKGLFYLLEACARLNEIGKNFICVIIGEGEERERLQKSIDALGLTDTVYLLGYIEDAAQYLKAFDIFTLTSVKEGHPYVLLEAARAKLPVVASDIPGVTDIIEHATTGLLSKSQNMAQIKDNLGILIEDVRLRAQYGNALKDKVGRDLSFQEMLNKTFALYSAY